MQVIKLIKNSLTWQNRAIDVAVKFLFDVYEVRISAFRNDVCRQFVACDILQLLRLPVGRGAGVINSLRSVFFFFSRVESRRTAHG